MAEDGLELVRLHDREGELEASFAPAAGMVCCSLRRQGEELLAQNAGLAAYAQRGKTMGIPLLYPWANRLAAFDYEVRGRTVAVPRDPARIATDPHGLPIHGVIGGRQHWRLSAPAQDGELTATLAWDEQQPALFEVFPFRHDLTYSARLRGGQLQITLTVVASGADEVPVAFGFHPYLAPPSGDRRRWRIELAPMRHLSLDEHQIPVGHQQSLAHQEFELAEREFDDGYDEVGDPARFSVGYEGGELAIELLRGYPCAQVFAPLSGRFICFEPMTAPANALRSGEGLRLLAPGERHEASFAVRVGARAQADG